MAPRRRTLRQRQRGQRRHLLAIGAEGRALTREAGLVGDRADGAETVEVKRAHCLDDGAGGVLGARHADVGQGIPEELLGPRPDPRGSCVRHWRSSTGRSPGRASPLAPVADLQRADIERHILRPGDRVGLDLLQPRPVDAAAVVQVV